MSAVEPNFSIYDQTPLAVGLWQIYRKRWLARFWQTRGVRIFVDMNVARPFAELNLVGVPKGWRAYATRGYTDRAQDTLAEYELARTHADGDVLFVVYGGGVGLRRLAQANGWLHVPEARTVLSADIKTYRQQQQMLEVRHG